jgi:hypothetical protein|tara:strand:- start:592 stop:990 length:399 start_codon:yes stop_codon:yes gene_type:complete
MGITVNITDFEDGKTASGVDFCKFNTSEGMISAWDEVIIKTLKGQCGNDVEVEIQLSKDGKYKSVRKIVKVGEAKPVPVVTAPVSRNAVESNKQAGVAMRYAVDLCISGKIQLSDIEVSASALHQSMKDLAE